MSSYTSLFAIVLVAIATQCNAEQGNTTTLSTTGTLRGGRKLGDQCPRNSKLNTREGCVCDANYYMGEYYGKLHCFYNCSSGGCDGGDNVCNDITMKCTCTGIEYYNNIDCTLDGTSMLLTIGVCIVVLFFICMCCISYFYPDAFNCNKIN